MLLCLTVGLSGSGLAATGMRDWFEHLAPPRFAPSVLVYLPVWSMIYTWAAFAAWDIWRNLDAASLNHRALTTWGWAMGLKALWTPVLFGLHWLLPALDVGLALLVTLGFTIARFWRLNRGAAALMLPFFFWVAFECYLGAGFWWLNR